MGINIEFMWISRSKIKMSKDILTKFKKVINSFCRDVGKKQIGLTNGGLMFIM